MLTQMASLSDNLELKSSADGKDRKSAESTIILSCDFVLNTNL